MEKGESKGNHPDQRGDDGDAGDDDDVDGTSTGAAATMTNLMEEPGRQTQTDLDGRQQEAQ